MNDTKLHLFVLYLWSQVDYIVQMTIIVAVVMKNVGLVRYTLL